MDLIALQPKETAFEPLEKGGKPLKTAPYRGFFRRKTVNPEGNAFNQAQRAIPAFEAQMVKADYDLDKTLRDLYFSKLGACGNNKKDPAILRWFPDGLTALIRCGFDEEAGKVAARNAWELVEAEKINWLVSYSKSYGDVLAVLEGDKHAADTFFKKPSKPKKGGGDAPEGPKA